MLLGPSWLGSIEFLQKHVLSTRCALIIEEVAALGLLLHSFFKGLEIRNITVPEIGMKIAFWTSVCTVLTILGLATLVQGSGGIFWGIALASTDFGEIAKILDHLGLQQSTIGQIGLNAARITDFGCWTALVVTLIVVRSQVFYSLIFLLPSILVVYPVLSDESGVYPVLNFREEEDDAEYRFLYLTVVLALVFLMGFLSDACGIHFALGAFMFGAMIPNGGLKAMMVEKAEGFLSEIMMPLYFLTVGWKVDFHQISNAGWEKACMVIALACLVKVIITLVVSWFQMPARDCLDIGLMLNTKGIFSIMVLSIGLDFKVCIFVYDVI